MFNFQAKDGERWMSRLDNTADDDRIEFGNLVENYMGREARQVFQEVVEGTDEHLDAVVEEECNQVEEHYRLWLTDIMNELEAIEKNLMDELSASRMNRNNLSKIRKDINRLYGSIYKNL
jgi:hypothetical protein